MRIAPIETPSGLFMRLSYWLLRRQLGKTITPWKVIFARIPGAIPAQLGIYWGLERGVPARSRPAAPAASVRRRRERVRVLRRHRTRPGGAASRSAGEDRRGRELPDGPALHRARADRAGVRRGGEPDAPRDGRDVRRAPPAVRRARDRRDHLAERGRELLQPAERAARHRSRRPVRDRRSSCAARPAAATGRLTPRQRGSASVSRPSAQSAPSTSRRPRSCVAAWK